MYKWLVLSDLDGTLLGDHGKLDPRVINYVKELNARKDIIFGFSTGRSWSDSKKIYEDLDLHGMVSCCNGAHIIHPKENIHIYSFLSQDLWFSILHNNDYCFKMNKMLFLTDKGDFIVSQHEDRGVFADKLVKLGANVFDVKSYFNIDPETEFHLIDDKLRILKHFPQRPNVTVHSYNREESVNIEFQPFHVSKESAMRYISNFYGVPAKRTLTFGDQVNDLSVAQGESRFTAVSNAIEIVKQYASLISTYTNRDLAVVEEIKAFLARHNSESCSCQSCQGADCSCCK